MNPRFWLRMIYERDGSLCHYCKIQLWPLEGLPKFDGGTLPNDYPTIDHFIAVADGGTNDLDNLVAACYPCNNDKGSFAGGGGRKRPRESTKTAAQRQDDLRRQAGQRPIPRLQQAQATNRKRWCSRCRCGWHGQCVKTCSCPESDCTSYRVFNPNFRGDRR